MRFRLPFITLFNVIHGRNDRYDWTTVVSLATYVTLHYPHSTSHLPCRSPASDSCVRISPDVSSDWETDEPLREGRTMGNMILLPTGKILMVNGANLGTRSEIHLPY